MKSEESVRKAARQFAGRYIDEGYGPDTLHTYTDLDGSPLYWKPRLKNQSTGDKKFLFFYRDNDQFRSGKPQFEHGEPLYNLSELHHNQTDLVIFVEGEKCVDSLKMIGVLATTTGGANTAKKANLTPLLGRKVVIWPDNDDPGKQYATELSALLANIVEKVQILDPNFLDLPEKADCCDWLKKNPEITKPLFEEFIKNILTDPTPAAQSPRLKILELDELLNLELPPRDLIFPWMPAQSLNMVHAWRGVGKTHFALGLSAAAAGGGSFLNWKANRPTKVLYVDGEMAASELIGRLHRIRESVDFKIKSENFMTFTPGVQGLNYNIPDLSTESGQKKLDSVIGDAELIVIDNLSCLVRGRAKENDAESWQIVQEWALKHRSAGRSLLFVHHSGKSGNQRGTSKKEDILDTVICLKRPDKYGSRDGAVFEVHFEKARHMCGTLVDPIEARLITDGAGKEKWEVKTVAEHTLDRVVSLSKEGLTPREISEELSIHKSTVSRNLRKARGP